MSSEQARRNVIAARDQLDILPTTSAQAMLLAEELFVVVDVLSGNIMLRRMLTDPAMSLTDKKTLLDRLFDKKIHGNTIAALCALVAQRWSNPAELPHAAEYMAVSAVLASAKLAHRLGTVEDELFAFARLISENSDLREAVSQRSNGDERKVALVRRLLNGKCAPETLRLATRAVVAARDTRPEHMLREDLAAAAEMRHEIFAIARTATPLTDDQRLRLITTLERRYGTTVRMTIDVDPSLMGGLRVQLPNHMIDGSVAGKFTKIRKELTST